MNNQKNILLTGLPRSGTTLLCHLLNKLENSVALHEPLPLQKLNNINSNELINAIEYFIEDQRRSIVQNKIAISKSSFGKVPSNELSDEQVDGKRKSHIDGVHILVENVSTPEFFL